MDSVTRILFPTDFSDVSQSAFRYALKLADFFEASVEVLHVVYPETEPLDFPVLATKVMKERTEAAREALKGFIDLGLSQVITTGIIQHIPVTPVDIEIGAPGEVIASVAARDEADLIIMGTRENHSALDRLLGSVTTSVVRKAPCPVWIVPPEAECSSFGSVVFATNLLESDPFHLIAVSTLLNRHDPVFRVVHVQKEPDEETELSLKEFETLFQEKLPDISATFHQTAGHSVIEEIDEVAGRFDADLIVMFRSHRGLFSRLAEPGITRKMALHTHYPLLVLK